MPLQSGGDRQAVERQLKIAFAGRLLLCCCTHEEEAERVGGGCDDDSGDDSGTGCVGSFGTDLAIQGSKSPRTGLKLGRRKWQVSGGVRCTQSQRRGPCLAAAVARRAT
ncbi:hypothetical protein NEUTE1DRAFT_138524 [Neurospora tetrasperma FGSC 2508]|uniref:Uncharacterized protein n=1 Tax=Neurospora tetrasperma (strain FGSC 2508 / ATCC MYA-4615 / P0657) TaxID=510951 RepID=F8MPP6_NEUT8|nr:uncharacterized protein NEUTE1DRAFT_138524 [Neurospora tetrasperma FGSC 2508]EGO56358.1 hypothetical protein NEUTE1DRAFT_138524 [Neurospora tetrasperma FGSC 2508]EGZ70784.1 hypothetical protein NEUTE2DRAFT_168121 [Neurospora tetrasperma FGSC 2509]